MKKDIFKMYFLISYNTLQSFLIIFVSRGIRFFKLHDAIKYDIRKEDTNMRKSITTEERLAVTLR